jgi:hypothetical protein
LLSSFDEASFYETSIDERSIDNLTFEETSIDNLTFEETSIDNLTFDETSFDETSMDYKQSARWQHLFRLKATAFFSLQKNLVSSMKCNNLYSGLVTPSCG